MDKLYLAAVTIFGIGWYIEQRMYVDGYTRRKRDLYKPIDYLGLFSIGEFVGYLIRCLIAPAFVWFPDILIGLPDNLIQAIAAVWLVVMSIFVPTAIERMIDGNDLVRFFTNHLFGGKIKDIMTGYRAFSYQFVKTYPVLSRGFEIETEMTIHALQRNMQVENVIIDYRDRPEGSESKLNTYSDGFKVLGTIARLFKNYRPFSFFGILAAILAVFGIGFMIPVLGEYFRTGLVPRFPTLIVCCFVLVAALLLFISGIILSSQLAKDARDFEFQLQTVHHWHSEKK